MSWNQGGRFKSRGSHSEGSDRAAMVTHISVRRIIQEGIAPFKRILHLILTEIDFEMYDLQPRPKEEMGSWEAW